jgi:hypothetical protein
VTTGTRSRLVIKACKRSRCSICQKPITVGQQIGFLSGRLPRLWHPHRADRLRGYRVIGVFGPAAEGLVIAPSA